MLFTVTTKQWRDTLITLIVQALQTMHTRLYYCPAIRWLWWVFFLIIFPQWLVCPIFLTFRVCRQTPSQRNHSENQSHNNDKPPYPSSSCMFLFLLSLSCSTLTPSCRIRRTSIGGMRIIILRRVLPVGWCSIAKGFVCLGLRSPTRGWMWGSVLTMPSPMWALRCTMQVWIIWAEWGVMCGIRGMGPARRLRGWYYWDVILPSAALWAQYSLKGGDPEAYLLLSSPSVA